jgi:hypothetical protein
MAYQLKSISQPRRLGGYTRVRRSEGLSGSVIGAVVQGTRRREKPFLGMRPWVFSGWSPEAVQFFKGLQADNTKALLERAPGVLRDLGARAHGGVAR